MAANIVAISAWLVAASACGSSSAPAPAPPVPASSVAAAELVMTGGTILTMDEQRPKVSAIAVRGARIVFVGDDAGARAYIGPKTRVVELAGRGVTPGLIDAHCHLLGLGGWLETIQLKGLGSAEAVAAKVLEAGATRASHAPPVDSAAGRGGADEWIVGRGWDQNLWTPREFPSHALLDVDADGAAIAIPIALRRVDGHALWANQAAMNVAGVDAKTPDPQGGQIIRDASGAPTGVFVDNAMDLIESKIPLTSVAAIERRIRRGAALAVSVGLTGVHEMGISDRAVGVYRTLAAADELPLRVYSFLQGDLAVARGLSERAPPERTASADAMFSLRAIKFYVDGALGSRGAALLAPYSDSAGTGLWVHTPEQLNEAVELAVARGWQIGVHAIGDAGNRAVLDAFAAAQSKRPGADLRLRVEHAQVLSPADIPRFAKLGVIASMQPTHATSDMPWAEDRLGPERIRGAYAWRSLLDSGAHIAAGSDFPIEEVSPLFGVYAAVSRQDAKGQPAAGWHPEQRMTLEEALAAFTREAAFASFSDSARGQLREGYLADITVYDRALASDSSLLETKVVMTVVGGRVVYTKTKLTK